MQQNHLEGSAGFSNRRFQIDAYGTSYGAVKALAESIKTAMAASSIINNHLSSQDLYEAEVQLYRVSMDFSVWS